MSEDKYGFALKSQALKATFWSGADIFVRQGLQFAISVALARLLSPEEYGTIALLYLFTGIAGAFVDSGFSNALIQNQDVSHADESTVFWLNSGLGLLASMALWGLAPSIASFFDAPILAPLGAVLALNIFISALGSIHATLFSKRLDFRTQMKIGAIATLISGGVAVVMAWLGFGVWALAAQAIVATVLSTGLLWTFSRWRPAFVFRMDSARRLFRFGGYLLVSSLLDIAYGRIYTLLIGKYYGVRELGFYNRAESTKHLPVGILTGILSRVAFPIFSAAALNKEQLRRGLQSALRGIMLLNVPMMLGLLMVAEPLVLTLFGARWQPAVPALRILCLSGLFWPLHVLNLNVLLAQGHSDLFFKLEIYKKALGVALLIAGAFYGVIGIAWSQVVFSVAGFALNSYYTKRHLDYGFVSQTLDILPILAVALLMMLGVLWADNLLETGPGPKLAILVSLGTTIFIGLGWIFRLAALRESINLVRQRSIPQPQRGV